MQVFQVRYRNTQGTLMRILNAASRRGLELTTVQSAPRGADFLVTLSLDANPKHTGQLIREWYSIMDVIEVPPPSEAADHEASWAAPHPPSSAGVSPVQALA
jgi:acetolactate synthase small subunit